jgi:hypothetical protein
MPKKGKAAARSRHLGTRRKRCGEGRQREDWMQHAPTAAQLASSIDERLRADPARADVQTCTPLASPATLDPSACAIEHDDAAIATSSLPITR